MKRLKYPSAEFLWLPTTLRPHTQTSAQIAKMRAIRPGAPKLLNRKLSRVRKRWLPPVTIRSMRLSRSSYWSSPREMVIEASVLLLVQRMSRRR